MKLLIELPTWMGDTVMVTPAIINLTYYFKKSKITLIGSNDTNNVLSNETVTLRTKGTLVQDDDISETLIGLTIVAIGTSLPEIATVIIASYRGQSQVALGGIIGSNIFNLLAVLGISGLTGPIDVNFSIISFDIWIMLLTALILVLLVLRRKPIGRKTGILFLLGYVVYLLVIINRGM